MAFVSANRDGFFRAGLTKGDFQFDWKGFIAAIKEYLPADERDYDDSVREWVFDEKKRQPITVLIRQFFPGREIEEI